MAGTFESRLSARPSPTYQELLDLETRPVPTALRENFNDHSTFGNDDIDIDRYLSPQYYRLELDRM